MIVENHSLHLILIGRFCHVAVEVVQSIISLNPKDLFKVMKSKDISRFKKKPILTFNHNELRGTICALQVGGHIIEI